MTECFHGSFFFLTFEGKHVENRTKPLICSILFMCFVFIFITVIAQENQNARSRIVAQLYKSSVFSNIIYSQLRPNLLTRTLVLQDLSVDSLPLSASQVTLSNYDFQSAFQNNLEFSITQLMTPTFSGDLSGKVILDFQAKTFYLQDVALVEDEIPIVTMSLQANNVEFGFTNEELHTLSNDELLQAFQKRHLLETQLHIPSLNDFFDKARHSAYIRMLSCEVHDASALHRLIASLFVDENSSLQTMLRQLNSQF